MIKNQVGYERVTVKESNQLTLLYVTSTLRAATSLWTNCFSDKNSCKSVYYQVQEVYLLPPLFRIRM